MGCRVIRRHLPPSNTSTIGIKTPVTNESDGRSDSQADRFVLVRQPIAPAVTDEQ